MHCVLKKNITEMSLLSKKE